jgi:hypothetical protein
LEEAPVREEGYMRESRDERIFASPESEEVDTEILEEPLNDELLK